MNERDEIPLLPRRWAVAVRLTAATCICLVILAITIPNLENTNQRFGYGWRDVLCVGMIVTPLILILSGVRRSNILEKIGWALLLILLFLRLLG